MKQTILLCLLAFVTTVSACETIDDVGHTIKLAHPAQRIISLAPDLTENLFAIGAGDRLVGVMKGSDFPAQAKSIPIVARYNAVDKEKILAAKPDLILVWGEGHLLESLEKLSIPIYVSHIKKITDIPNTLIRLGCLTGQDIAAAQAAKQFLQRYHALQARYQSKPKITVFYQVWQPPLITIAQSSWINDMIAGCGGQTIFRRLKSAAPVVNLEAVLMQNPDVIIASNLQHQWRVFWQQWPQLSAVKKNHLFTVNADEIERATPRLLNGMESVCRQLESARP